MQLKKGWASRVACVELPDGQGGAVAWSLVKVLETALSCCHHCTTIFLVL